MKEDHVRRFLTLYMRGQLSRRALIRRLALMGVSLPTISALLAACGGGGEAPPETATTDTGTATTPTTAAEGSPSTSGETAGIPDYIDPSKLSKELNFYNWSEYVDPDLLTKFEEVYGVKVTQDTYASNEDLLAKLQGGATGYDVIVPSDYMVSVMINLDMLEPLDYDVIKTIENIDPNNLKAYYDPDNTYSVPYMWGTSGYSYDTSVLGEGLDSWDSLFNPPAEAQGKVVMLDDQREVIGAALMFLGHPINETSDDALAEAKELLLQQKPHVLAYTSQNNDDMLISGEAVMSHIWTGDALLAADEKDTLVYVIPKEGCTIWQDNLCVPRGAPNLYTAMAFIDFLNLPEVSGQNANYIWYATPNKAAVDGEHVDEALLANEGVYPPADVMGRLQWIEDVGDDILKYDKLWTEFKTA